MSYRNDRYEIRLAQPDDAAQLLHLYECDEYSGNISVLYTRRPDTYASLMHEGEKVIIPVVVDRDNDTIIGMGACMIREAYINGEVRHVGYLAGLKGLPEYRKRVPYIQDVYRFLHEKTRDDVDLYYTTILKENVAAQKMLEKKRKNMPEYRPLGEYTVYCIKTGTKATHSGFALEKGSLTELQTMMDDDGVHAFHFSPVNAQVHEVSDDDGFILRSPSGKIVGACALWNQQNYKQYIVTQYKGMYGFLKRMPTKWLGYPSFPKENIPANYASVALITVQNHNPQLAEILIKQAAEKAYGYDFLMVGFMDHHPYADFMRRFKSVQYKSLAYTVHFDDKGPFLDQRPIHLEVGLL